MKVSYISSKMNCLAFYVQARIFHSFFSLSRLTKKLSWGISIKAKQGKNKI
jgi:hypothetical protein